MPRPVQEGANSHNLRGVHLSVIDLSAPLIIARIHSTRQTPKSGLGLSFPLSSTLSLHHFALSPRRTFPSPTQFSLSHANSWRPCKRKSYCIHFAAECTRRSLRQSDHSPQNTSGFIPDAWCLVPEILFHSSSSSSPFLIKAPIYHSFIHCYIIITIIIITACCLFCLTFCCLLP